MVTSVRSVCMTNAVVNVLLCELLTLWSKLNVSIHLENHHIKGVRTEFHHLSKLICRQNHTVWNANSPTNQPCIHEFIRPMLISCHQQHQYELEESTPVPW